MHPAYLYVLAMERQSQMKDAMSGRPVSRPSASRRRILRRRP